MTGGVATVGLAAGEASQLRALIEDDAVQVIVLDDITGDVAPDTAGSFAAAVRDATQPVIGVVPGPCVGPAAVVAMACDLIVMATDATIGGFRTPSWFADGAATQTLRSRVGQGRAARLLYTGATMRGSDAEAAGLVDLTSPSSRVRAAATTLAESLAVPSGAARAIKSHLASGEQVDVAEHGPAAVPSAQGPVWTDRDAADGVTVDRCGGALRITLDRPQVLNAFDDAMSDRLASVIATVADDRGTRVVMITGAGRAFSAGADLGAFDDDAAQRIETQLREIGNPMIRALRSLRQPVVAAVNGPAVGVGCSIALACDLVVASTTATFQLAFSNVGLSLDGGATATVLARAGFSVASRMALLGAPLPADAAVQAGLIDQVAFPDEFAAAAESLLLRLADGPTRSYAATKRLLNARAYDTLAGVLDQEASTFGTLARTRDFAAAVEAFGRRQRPTFVGFGDGVDAPEAAAGAR